MAHIWFLFNEKKKKQGIFVNRTTIYCIVVDTSRCYPEPQRKACLDGRRDASLRLSMTGWSRLLLPASVTLSRSEGSGSLDLEMLRCGSG